MWERAPGCALCPPPPPCSDDYDRGRDRERSRSRDRDGYRSGGAREVEKGRGALGGRRSRGAPREAQPVSMAPCAVPPAILRARFGCHARAGIFRTLQRARPLNTAGYADKDAPPPRERYEDDRYRSGYEDERGRGGGYEPRAPRAPRGGYEEERGYAPGPARAPSRGEGYAPPREGGARGGYEDERGYGGEGRAPRAEYPPERAPAGGSCLWAAGRGARAGCL
jgi:hypothetical protein